MKTNMKISITRPNPNPPDSGRLFDIYSPFSDGGYEVTWADAGGFDIHHEKCKIYSMCYAFPGYVYAVHVGDTRFKISIKTPSVVEREILGMHEVIETETIHSRGNRHEHTDI